MWMAPCPLGSRPPGPRNTLGETRGPSAHDSPSYVPLRYDIPLAPPTHERRARETAAMRDIALSDDTSDRRHIRLPVPRRMAESRAVSPDKLPLVER